MLANIIGVDIPHRLKGFVLVDEMGIPRYWAVVYTTLFAFDLENSTISKKLRSIEELYCLVDALKGRGAMDDLLGEMNIDGLCDMLEAFFTKLQNDQIATVNREDKWRSALDFVMKIMNQQARSMNATHIRTQGMMKRVGYLSTLYSQLKVAKPRRPTFVRSLPANVVKALIELIQPDFPTNPFRNEQAKWRVYMVVTALLNLGLRRGELLSLPVDALKSSYDEKQKRYRHWLDVRENDYEDDPRGMPPSLKTVDAYRQIPVDNHTVGVLQTYIDNYRGKPGHSFFVNSQQNLPMSAVAMTYVFQTISDNLPRVVMKELKDRTGKDSITPHDLRHTRAVAILNQLLDLGDQMDEALAKMRSFFGWSRTSDMPSRYAKAVFEDRLAVVWSTIFDEQIEILRALPKGM